MGCFRGLRCARLWKETAYLSWVLGPVTRIKLLWLWSLSCSRVSTWSFIWMAGWAYICLGLFHESVWIVKHRSVRWRYGTWVIMWLQDTFLECILNREVIVSSSSGSFAKLLFDSLLNAILLVVSLYHHHFAWILLNCIFLNIWTGSHLLGWSYLHSCLWSITQNILVTNRVSICLKQWVSDPLPKTIQFIIHNHARSELVFKQTVIHRVISEISRQLIPIRRHRVFHGPAQILHWLRAILKFLLYKPTYTRPSRSLRHVGAVIIAPLHPLDNHLVLGLIRFLFNRDDLFSEHCLSNLFVNCLFRYVFLNCVERILIWNVDASVSFCLRGLHTYLNSWFLIVTLGMVATSSWIRMNVWSSRSSNGNSFGVLICHWEGQVFILLDVDSLVHGFSLI